MQGADAVACGAATTTDSAGSVGSWAVGRLIGTYKMPREARRDSWSGTSEAWIWLWDRDLRGREKAGPQAMAPGHWPVTAKRIPALLVSAM